MPYEHDDQGLRIIGYNTPIRFYDPTRTLRAEIFLQSNNTLNVGGLSGTGGTGGTGTTTAHGLGDMAIHTGVLADIQAPQFLKADGSRPLSGNLTVSDSVTIDGVDLSGFKGAYDNHVVNVSAHHNPVTIGTGGLSAKLGLVGQVLTLARIDHSDLGGVTADQHHAGFIGLEDNAGTAVTPAADDRIQLLTGNTILGIVAGTNTLTFTVNQGNIDHGSLGGLGDDDHPQYAALAQNESITGAWRFTNNLTTRHILPANTDTYDLGSSTLLWRKGWLSELDTVIFAENTITLLGGWFYITKYAGTVNQSITLVDTQIDLGVDNNVLSTGDHIAFRQSGKVEYMTLGSYNSVSHKWNVTRNVDGSGIDTWPDGAPFVALGKAGDGRIELNAYDTPRISIVKQGAKWNEQTELIRMGDLNGLADYTTENYGIFIGDFAGNKWLAYDQTNSLRIRGDALIQGTVDATKFTVGMSDQFFSRSDGLLLLGPYDAITATTWTSQRGQTATISGAFHQVAGPWAGSRALMVERGTRNLVANPSFEVGVTGWTQVNGTRTRSTAHALFGSASLQIAGAYSQAYTTISPAGTTVTASFWFKVVQNTNGQRLGIRITDSGGSTLATAVIPIAQMDGNWHRVQVTYDGASTPARVYARAVDSNVGGTLEWYVDGVQAEEYPYATSYCDGDQGSGYSWTGTAHNSTSARTSTWGTLDAHVAALNGLSTVTHSILVQAQYDADDPNWPSNVSGFSNTAFVVDARGSSSANQVGVYYLPGSDAFAVYINGSNRITVADQTFAAGDWLHLVVTLDFTANDYRLYLNGVQIGSSSAALSAPTGLATWKLGVPYHDNVNYYGGWVYAEYAAFATVLTAEQVAALYHRNAPLADAGAMDTPGIYILDGEFKIASSTSGTRIEITPEMIAGYSDATTKQFYLQASDGKAYAGDGAVILDEDGILITTADLQENLIKFENSDITLAAGVTGLLNLQSVDPDSNAYGAFNYGWATNDGKNRSLVSCWQHEIDFLIQKAGDYRYVLEANYDYIRTNAPLIVVAQSAEPSTGVANGMLYYDTDTNKLMVRANGSWVALH